MAKYQHKTKEEQPLLHQRLRQNSHAKESGYFSKGFERQEKKESQTQHWHPDHSYILPKIQFGLGDRMRRRGMARGVRMEGCPVT